MFNYTLRNRVTVVIQCMNNNEKEKCIGNILDDISQQYYANGVNVIIVNNGFEDEVIEKVKEKRKELDNINIKLIGSSHDLRKCDTSHLFFIEDGDRLDSRWALFNSVKNGETDKNVKLK